MPEEEKQEQKEEDKVVLTTDMHCYECQRKVNKVLKNFPGVEKIDLDARERKVTVKGKVDAKKVFEAVKEKCGKRTVLVYPQLSKEDEKKNEEEKPKEEPPPDVTVELRVKMHCGACAKAIKKKLSKMNGVTEVHEDVASDKVVVKGKGLDAEKLCEKVRKSGKHCEVIPPPPPPPPQKEEKKEEEKKEEAKEAEEKKEEKKEEKQEEGNVETKVEVKKYVYPPYRGVHEYMYPPQLFSDENPNACSIL